MIFAKQAGDGDGAGSKKFYFQHCATCRFPVDINLFGVSLPKITDFGPDVYPKDFNNNNQKFPDHASSGTAPGTTYINACFELGALPGAATSAHAVGFSAHIDPTNIPYVHHFVLQGSKETGCGDDGGGVTVYGWAPGVDDYAFPDNVGLLVGDGGFRSFLLQTHYNTNSSIATNSRTDNSGVRLYFTNQKRSNDVGVLSLGDPSVALAWQSSTRALPEGRSAYAFKCSSDFTKKYFKHSINVFGSTLHMHGSGLKMQTRRYADGTGPVEVLNDVEFYDYNFQSIEAHDYSIRPGDKLITECFFYSKPGQNWGLATEDEMCIDFVYYYPALSYEGRAVDRCSEGVLGENAKRTFSADDSIGRLFG